MQQPAPRPRYAPARPLPPYAYVPGAGLPHPVNDPGGHLHESGGQMGQGYADERDRNAEWNYAVDLFNHGFPWEAHEAWEGVWHALGRTTPDALAVRGLIHLAAACVKIREGRPVGVARHARRARDLLTNPLATSAADGVLGIAPPSIEAVLRELEGYLPACWHTAAAPAVSVLSAVLERTAGSASPAARLP